MSGHSKWSTIKHKKGAADAKRGKLFSKLIREITIAARNGSDPGGNPRLRSAVLAARSANMPGDTIDRAIKKGSGELGGADSLEEVIYEGYGPGGVAILLEVVTDNKKRTVAEIRHLFSKYNGNLGENGCVAWMFTKKGLIAVDKNSADEDKLMEVALDAGAEDISDEDDHFEVTCDPSVFSELRDAIQAAGIDMLSAEITMIPSTTVELDGKPAQTMLKLMEKLDDHDDVQNVYANFDIDPAIMEEAAG
ncbi:MAG: YebC/PmpR family DNA-binding transcriptional regulator [Deltaproteobacteria bacterium]|nr:YebC/PmpR family DNA-binding transcriptional regulator [Deltaproteobacteria bacterium]